MLQMTINDNYENIELILKYEINKNKIILTNNM